MLTNGCLDMISHCSAAIYGLRGKQDVSIYILYPYGRVSPIQEQQMATVPDENVHCVAVDGTFDDCQVRPTRRSIGWSFLSAELT